MNPDIIGLLAAIFYSASTWLQIKVFINRTVPPPVLIRQLALPAMLLHAVTLYLVMDTPAGVDFGVFVVFSLTGLIFAMVVFIASLRLPLDNLLILAFPVALLGLTTSLTLSSDYQPDNTPSPGLLIHIFCSISAYTLLLMAACQALILQVQARLLRNKVSIGLLRLLPPLETMEHSLFGLLRAGVAVLSLAIGSGFLFLNNMFAQHIVHHTILSIASWIVFVGLLVGRKYLGWRGQIAIRWTLSGFGLLLLAYFGSKFVMEVIISN
ncbi:MAG: cytochrome c biogenesis protein CcsA [Pseudomonadales bacterium]|nr:cytochrome c biogenesis protein CcsA [Pseudomonadales bacterium]